MDEVILETAEGTMLAAQEKKSHVLQIEAQDEEKRGHESDSASPTPSEKAFEDDIVDFEANDPLNPRCWSKWRKWTLVVLVSIMLTVSAFGTSTVVPAAPTILSSLHVSNPIYSVLLVSIWELGEGVGPFLYAPLSETYGRLPVFHAGNLVFLITMIGSGFSVNMSMLVAFRFLNGLSTTVLTLSPSIVGDIFAQEERGFAIALNSCLPVAAAVAAPIVGGFITEAAGWRWTVWIVLIPTAFLVVLLLLVFRETYQVTILEKKAKKLRAETGNERLRSRHQNTVDKTTFADAMLRPMKVLIFSPVVLIMNCYMSLAYGLMYIIFTTMTEIFQEKYHFSEGIIGVSFMANTIGNVVGLFTYGFFADRYLKHCKAQRGPNGEAKAEDRLPFMIAGALFLSGGFLLYGWTLQFNIHWAAPLTGSGMVGLGLVLVILPVENYLVDIFDLYGASAVASGVILRAFVGAFFPLISPPLYARLGLGWGNSVLALVGATGIPFVVLVWRCGEQMRKAETHFDVR